MNLLKNLSIRNKLFILALLPILGLLFYSVNNIIEKSNLSSELNDLTSITEFSVISSTLVHETQKERGATAGFLGSKGTKFSSELKNQRKDTDNKKNIFNKFLEDVDLSEFSVEFTQKVNSAKSQLGNLPQIRSQVDAQSISVKDAIAYYSQFNATVLDIASQIASMTTLADLSNRATAYANYLKAKERAGIERAVLSNTFAADKFGDGMYKKFIELVSEQESYTDVFMSLATNEQISFYNNKLQGEAVNECNRMRDIAFSNMDGNFGVDATYWFKKQTAKINLLKEVEDQLSEQIHTNSQDLANSSQSSLIINLIITSVLLLATFTLTFLIIGGITKPINKVVLLTDQMNTEFEDFVSVVEAISNNDLTQTIEQKEIENLNIDAKDEIGIMSRAIESTLASKKAIGDALNKMCGNLVSVIGSINQNSQAVSTAATEISASAEQMSQGATKQSEQVNQVSVAVEEVAATIVESTKNATDAKDASQKASETAGSGGQIVSDTIHGMQKISDVVQESAESITKLATSADQIGEIISVIDDIADQTNLLALNAAIEAARAGEQGRGFAVVADEVRKLAERTGKATGEITEMIKGIQNQTTEAVGSMETGIKEVTQGRELADKAGNSLNEIVTMSQSVVDMITQIATASEEQSAATEEISKNIEHISTVTKETEVGAHESAKAAEQLNQQAEELKAIVNQFKL